MDERCFGDWIKNNNNTINETDKLAIIKINNGELVADVKNNQLIEAKGYDSGFARVQKITIEKRFSNISCWKDIIKLHLSKSSLFRSIMISSAYRI